MTPSRDTPMYNLKAVVQETGLKPDTLRAWERRYGMPSPQRTGSGHRLYAQRDIELLHWLKARLDEGLSISRAVELWARMGEAEAHRGAAAGPVERPAHMLSPLHAGTDPISELREQWLAACLRFDESAAEQTLAQAFALFSPEIVCLEIIQQAMARIGDGWYRGHVTVQQEHFASALALRRIEAMIAATPHPSRAGRILIGCPPEEAHTFVPLLISLLLRRRGWDTIYLGANVPLISMETTLHSTQPSLVILTAQQLKTAASLLEMAHGLLQQRIPLGYGGLIFNRVPELQRAIPGHYLGERIEGVVAQVEQMLGNLHVQLAQRTPSHELREALAHFRARRSMVEAGIWQRMEGNGMQARLLAAANENFGDNLIASMELGSLEYLSADMAWLEGLLLFHVGMAAEQIADYLAAYAAASEAALDERGRILVQWLRNQKEREPPDRGFGELAQHSTQPQADLHKSRRNSP